MKRSESIAELAAALAAYAADVQNPANNRTASVRSPKGDASSFSFPYADLAAVLEAVRPPLAAHGLSLTQGIEEDEYRRIGARTFLFHASGQWLEFDPVWIHVDEGDAKTIGIAITYSRRYGILAALGVAAETEDKDAPPAPAQQGRRSGSGPRPATTKQLARIRKSIDAFPPAIAARTREEIRGSFKVHELEELTTKQASDVIDRIEEIKANELAGVDPATGEITGETKTPRHETQEAAPATPDAPEGTEPSGAETGAESLPPAEAPAFEDAEDFWPEEGAPHEPPADDEEPPGMDAAGFRAKTGAPEPRATNPEKAAIGRLVHELQGLTEYDEAADLEARFGIARMEGRSALTRAQAEEHAAALTQRIAEAREGQ